MALTSCKVVMCLATLMAVAGVEAVESEQTLNPEERVEKGLPTSPKAKQKDENAGIKRFQADLVRAVGRIVSEQDYPREAVSGGWQGTTMVRVEIGPDGLLKAATVTQSSGYSILDDRAVSKIRSVPLPEVPDELRERTFSVEIPFRFRLKLPRDIAVAPAQVERGSGLAAELTNEETTSDPLKRYGILIAYVVARTVSAGDYPLEARKQGWQGLTVVRLRFETDGLIKDVTVAQSSGFPVLDEYAVSKIRAMTPPDIPEELRGRAFNVSVPFRFQLYERTNQEGPILQGASLK